MKKLIIVILTICSTLIMIIGFFLVTNFGGHPDVDTGFLGWCLFALGGGVMVCAVLTTEMVHAPEQDKDLYVDAYNENFT